MSPSKVSSITWDSFHNTIDGEARGGKEKHFGINPSTGEKLWPVPIGSQQDVDDAVQSAEKAFESWSQTTVEKRKELIQKFVRKRDVFEVLRLPLILLIYRLTGRPLHVVCG